MNNKVHLLLNFVKRNYSRFCYYFISYPYYKTVFRAFGRKSKILRPMFLTPEWIEIGDHVFVRDGARIEGVHKYLNKEFTPKITLEDHVAIEQNIHLTCANSVYISKNTAIAANVTITDIDHPYTDINLPPEQQDIVVGEVFIGEDCKIYNNVVILPNTRLGKHTVVGANSVVLGNNYPDFCVLVGTPAKVVKRYCFKRKAWLTTDKKGDFLDNDKKKDII